MRNLVIKSWFVYPMWNTQELLFDVMDSSTEEGEEISDGSDEMCYTRHEGDLKRLEEELKIAKQIPKDL